MPYREVMALPMKVFWQLSGNTSRLLAEERKVSLQLAVLAANNPEAAAELYERLDKQSPDPMVYTGAAMIKASAVRDNEGFNELRSLAI
jgi:hypothetical protein